MKSSSSVRLLAAAACILLPAGCAPVGVSRGPTPSPGETPIGHTPAASAAVTQAPFPSPFAVVTPQTAAPPPAITLAPAPIPPNAPTPVGTPGAAFTPQAPGARFMVFGGPEGTHYQPTTDGETLVWTDGLDRIRATRLSDGKEYPVVGQATGLPDLSVAETGLGPVVAWRVPEVSPDCPPLCRGHLEAKNLATGATLPTTGAENAWSPAISRDWLVWWRGDYGPGPNGPQVITRTLMALDLRGLPAGALAPPTALYTTDRQAGLILDGDLASWVEGLPATSGPTDQGTATLRTLNLNTREMKVLAEGDNIGFGGSDLAGDLLVYPDRALRSFTAVNLRTGWRKDFPHAQEPATDGRYIFWVDSSQSPSLKLRIDLWGFDTASGAQFPVAVEAGVNEYPVARGGAAVWLHHDGTIYGVTQVYALKMSP